MRITDGRVQAILTDLENIRVTCTNHLPDNKAAVTSDEKLFEAVLDQVEQLTGYLHMHCPAGDEPVYNFNLVTSKNSIVTNIVPVRMTLGSAELLRGEGMGLAVEPADEEARDALMKAGKCCASCTEVGELLGRVVDIALTLSERFDIDTVPLRSAADAIAEDAGLVAPEGRSRAGKS